MRINEISGRFFGVKRIKIKPDDERTIPEVLEEFTLLKESENVAPKTVKNYNQSIGKFQKEVEIELITELNDRAVIAWKTAMLKSGISKYSINHYLRDLRAFTNYCISKNYIEPFTIELVRQQEEGIKFLSPEDMKKLLAKPTNKDSFATWRSWMIVNWVYATGNRESTICSIQIGDINFSANQIHLRHTKSRKLQNIPLSRTLATLLKEYIRKTRRDSPPTDLLFPSVGNTQLTPDGLRQAHTEYCKKRGVSNTSLHGIRHTFAQEWINNNGSTYQLQIMLGHSTPTMTQKYLRACGTRFDNFEDFNPLDKAKASANRKEVVLTVKEEIARDDDEHVLIIEPEINQE